MFPLRPRSKPGVRKAKQFTIRFTDRPGRLGEIASALWQKSVNIQAFLADIHAGQGRVHLVVDNPAIARKVFAAHGWNVTEEEIAALTLPDKPGSLAAVASKLGRVGINIEYAYTGPAKAKGKVNTYLAISDLAGAFKALR